VITSPNTITQDMTPTEAANLLTKLKTGHQAAWLATYQAPCPSAEFETRFRNATEVDGIFRTVMWETLDNGMRRPGESVDRFAERAHAEAKHAEAPSATANGVLHQTPAVVPLGHAGISPVDNAGWPLSDLSAPLGQAYARAFSDTAAAHVRELRRRDPLPEPDRTPGTPHPDPVLADRGWHVNERGIYTRRAQPEPRPQRGCDLEAGS
jgi:hypothetical protein